MPPWSPRVMWWSNFMGTVSGYGIQSQRILWALRDAGVPVAQTPNVGWSEATKLNVDGIPVYPQGAGDRRIGHAWLNARQFKANVLTTLYDTWAIEDMVPVAQEMKQKCLLVPYVPFDSQGMNPYLKRNLQAADYVISMSDHGTRLLKEEGFQNHTRIHHGVDTDVFKPWLGETDADGRVITKEAARVTVGQDPSEFLIGMVFMNKGTRKRAPENLEGVKLFIDRNPDVKVRLRLHTIANTIPIGLDLPAIVEKLGLKNNVQYSQDYDVWHGVDPMALALLYSTFDVTLFASGTEGFGVPAIESMACGVPVIVTDYAAQPELIRDVTPELIVPVKDTVWEPMSERWASPDREGICKALETVLNSDPERYTKRLRDHAVKNFSWSVIGPQWVKFYKETLPKFVDVNCVDIPDNAWPPAAPKEMVFG